MNYYHLFSSKKSKRNGVKNLYASMLLCCVISVGYAQGSFDDGYKAFFDHNYLKASQILESVVSQDPNHEKACYYLGQAYIKLDQKEKAKILYDKAISENKKLSKSGLILVGQGHLALLAGDSIGARSIFEDAITLSRKDPDVFTAIGYANLEPKGNLEYATQVLEEAIQSKRFANVKAYTFLGLAYKQLKDGSKSVQAFNNATRMDPHEAEAYFQVGKIFATQQNEEVFLQNYYNAVNADLEFFPTYFELALYYFNKGQVDSTRKYLNIYSAKSIAAGEDPNLIKTHQAALLFLDKKHNESLQLLASINTKLDESHHGYNFITLRKLRLAALNYDAQKDYNNALKSIQDYVTIAEKSKEGLEFSDMFLYMTILLNINDNTVKDTYFKSALDKAIDLKSEEQVKKVMLRKIQDLCAKMNYPVGVAMVKIKQLSISTNLAPTDYFEVGRACLAAGLSQQAIGYISEYIKQQPQDPSGYFLLAQANVAIDSTLETSKPLFEKYINLASSKLDENKSGIVTAYTFMGMYYTKSKKFDDALTWWDKVLSVEPTNASATNIKAQLINYKKQIEDYKKRQAEYERKKKELSE